jgi:hypothetical protein
MRNEALDESNEEEDEHLDRQPQHRLCTRTQTLQQIYQAIHNNHDKLAFFVYQPNGQTRKTWYLVQVNLDKTNSAADKTHRQYWIQWLICHHSHSKNKLVK